MRGLQKHTITLGLMTISIALLVGLQILWLRGSYNDARENFSKETNSLLRSTIFALHDSLIQRNLEPIPDSLKGFLKERSSFKFRDSVRFKTYNYSDSLRQINVTEKTARVEIYSSLHKRDSIEKAFTSAMRGVQEPKTFILRLGSDSLSKDSIRLHYRRALNHAGIDLSFQLLSFNDDYIGDPEFQKAADEGEIISEIIPFSPMSHYAVKFSGTENVLMKEIVPQILFAVFLTLLTTGSFFMMYRNLRTQQKLIEIKNDFISNVTHELKTPVATVSVALEALKNFNALDNPKRTNEYLEIAQTELNRLSLITDKILKTSVFEDKAIALEIKNVDLDLLTQRVLASMKLVFEKRSSVLKYEKEGMDFIVKGSEEHLTNVLYNLLDNALKYSGDQSVIEVIIKGSSNAVTLSVKDNGFGIPAEYQKKVFEKFFRVPSGDIHTIKGYGLGLSYVSSVVGSHGGEILVESEPGSGSTFTIKLPKT